MITVTVTENNVSVDSPYNRDFIDGARALGGKWENSKWNFSPRYEQQVRELCLDVYGMDGTPTQTVTLRIDLDSYNPGGNELVLAGRQILKKWGRDSKPKLGTGCAVVAGSLKSSGGSNRYPDITWNDGTVIEVLDVPLLAAQKLVDGEPESFSIVSDEPENEFSATELKIIEMLKNIDPERLTKIMQEVQNV